LSLLRNLLNGFYSSQINLHFQQQCIKTPYPLYLHQHLLFVFLMKDILTVVMWNCSVILICIPLIAKDMNISSCIYQPSILLRMFNLFNLIFHLLIWLCVLLLYNFSSLYTWVLTLFPMNSLKRFSPNL
jgi:hypothetical protein